MEPPPSVPRLDPADWAACAALLDAAGDDPSARLAARIAAAARGAAAPVALPLSPGERALLRRAHQRRLDDLLGPCGRRHGAQGANSRHRAPA